MAFRSIYLYGHLAEKYGKEHKFNVGSFAEVIKAFECNYTGFSKEFIPDEYYYVYHGDEICENSLLYPEEYNMISTEGDFHIVPDISGGKGQRDKGGGMLGVGVAIIAVAGGFFSWNPTLVALGASFLLSGATSLLAPVPEKTSTPEEVENGESFVFSNPKNAIRQGGVVPLVYGKHLVGSTVISSYMEATTYISEIENE